MHAKSLNYRPEIDGLRAIAVMIVILFHANFGVAGGYIGVDVFFVISGFLITRILWNDLNTQRFSITHFWEKRARRIVPALVVMSVMTLIASWFILPVEPYLQLAKAAVSQVYCGANFYYWYTADYYAGSSAVLPLLHTWSLAVEEQFYFLLPLALAGLFRIKRWQNHRVILVTMSLAFVLSLALSIHGVSRYPLATFYLLPTRAWELLMGALLVFLPTPAGRFNNASLREIISLLGLSMILVPALVYSKNTLFPGMAAVAPCLGTAMLIWANTRDNPASVAPTWVGRVLSLRPVVFVGLISYSLYLYHWPLLALASYELLDEPRWEIRLALVLVAFGCAILSWQYVETPFRVKRWCPSRKSMLVMASLSLLVLFNAGQLVLFAEGFPKRSTTKSNMRPRTGFFNAFLAEMTISQLKAGDIRTIGREDAQSAPQLMVWGDSHAMAAMPAIDKLLSEKGLSGRAVTRAVTAPVVEWYQINGQSPKLESPQFSELVLDIIQREKIPSVILIARWSIYTAKGQNDSGPVEIALEKTVSRLIDMGCRVWVVLDVPGQQAAMNAYWKNSHMSHVEKACTRPDPSTALDGFSPASIAKIRANGAHIIDLKPQFLDPSGKFYRIQDQGKDLYMDFDHLSVDGAMLMLLPIFREKLDFTHRPTRQDAISTSAHPPQHVQ